MLIERIEQIRDFIFKKDLWILDFVSCICFALAMGAFVQYGADSGQIYSDKILFTMLRAGASYLGTFIVAFPLRNRLKSIRSWAWIGIGGALVQIIVRLISSPSLWSYYQTNGEVVSVVIANWILWAILGCFCIFFIRLIAYLLIALRKPELPE